MPENTVYVGRPGRWGNPYAVGDESAFIGGTPVLGIEEPLTGADAAELFRLALASDELDFTVNDARAELRGKNLACWCPLDEPCHADVLLELANRP
jgi:hypothetical protein